MFEKWQSVENFVALSCDGQVLAKVTVGSENEASKTVSFTGLLTGNDAEWIVYAYENPLPAELTEKEE